MRLVTFLVVPEVRVAGGADAAAASRPSMSASATDVMCRGGVAFLHGGGEHGVGGGDRAVADDEFDAAIALAIDDLAGLAGAGGADRDGRVHPHRETLL
jgi:hypothetical protein